MPGPYQAVEDTKISFHPENLITAIEVVHEGWWQATGQIAALACFLPTLWSSLSEDPPLLATLRPSFPSLPRQVYLFLGEVVCMA